MQSNTTCRVFRNMRSLQDCHRYPESLFSCNRAGGRSMIHQLCAEGPIESPLPMAMLVTSASRCIRAAILASCRTAYPRSVETAWLANKTAQNIADWLPVAQHDAFFHLRGERVEGVALVARQRHLELICVHPEVQRLGVATRLFATIRSSLQPTQLEAHAPLPSVNWYLKHGFTIRAAPLVEGGVLWDIPLVWRAGFDR
jgi:GNAT superfamily N-acetyltransferase